MSKKVISSIILLLLLSTVRVSVTIAQPEIHVNPSRGHNGSVVYIYGCGFHSDTNINIYFDSMLVVKDSVSSYGCFSTYIQIPISAYRGYHIIKAIDSSGTESSAEFEVTNPVITVEPLAGNIGTKVHVTVSDLTPEEFYYIKFDELHIITIASDSDGKLDFEFGVPPVPNGTHYIRIVYPPWILHYDDDVHVVKPFDVVKASFKVNNGIVEWELINRSNDNLEHKIQIFEQSLNSTKQELNSIKLFNIILLIISFILGILVVITFISLIFFKSKNLKYNIFRLAI